MGSAPKQAFFTEKLWSLLAYGLGLGVLLAALQAVQYRLLVLDHSLEIYIGLVAVLFTVLGIWAGRRWSKKTPGAPEMTTEANLEQVLEKLHITPREFEVLQWIAQGLSNQEIAAQMFVSLNTVKTHTANLFSKLEVQRRTQAVQKAQELGLLSIAPPKV